MDANKPGRIEGFKPGLFFVRQKVGIRNRTPPFRPPRCDFGCGTFLPYDKKLSDLTGKKPQRHGL